MNESILILYLLTGSFFNIPAGLLSAVCYVESTHVANKINHHDSGSPSYGLCQIKMATAVTLGFVGSKEDLLIPSINVYYAGAYLAKQLSRYDDDITKAVAAYNSGTFGLDSCGNPKNKRYVAKVFKAWKEGK